MNNKQKNIRRRMNNKQKNIPIIKVHHGTCDCCHRENILVVHYNYHTQPDRDFRLCVGCYIKGEIIRFVEAKLMKLENGEIYEVDKI